eukprot:TRINITY_DN9255_c0_g1_i1.p1 TRINITY_DN9255_c0_g1~~TRINITY_DN9255_c0_g1_i1.p1  ORF type:complete len:275 (-),score=19.95 TRINITY_DN9255_c0_g1_i1:122-871(-)
MAVSSLITSAGCFNASPHTASQLFLTQANAHNVCSPCSISSHVEWSRSSTDFSFRHISLRCKRTVPGSNSASRRGPVMMSVDPYDRRGVDRSENLIEDPYGHVEAAMSSPVVTTSPEASLEDVLPFFEKYTGVPVVNEAGHCMGILSNIDVAKFARGGRAVASLPTTKVHEVMTSPAVVILQHAPVAYAAGLMLKHKVHRLPVVNLEGEVVGIITRNDIYEPLVPSVNPLLHRVVGKRESSQPGFGYGA